MGAEDPKGTPGAGRGPMTKKGVQRAEAVRVAQAEADIAFIAKETGVTLPLPIDDEEGQ